MIGGLVGGFAVLDAEGVTLGAALADAGGAVAFTAIGAVADEDGVGSAVALTWIGSPVPVPLGSGALVCLGSLLQPAAKTPSPTRAAPWVNRVRRSSRWERIPEGYMERFCSTIGIDGEDGLLDAATRRKSEDRARASVVDHADVANVIQLRGREARETK